MIDHIGIDVADFARAKAFYEKALAPLGMTVLTEFLEVENGPFAGMGDACKPFFWFGAGKAPSGAGSGPIHIAFTAKDRASVDAFYAAALAAGGTDNGPPGLRPIYHADYYGAFVLDPDGNNVEAVCHHAE